MGSERIYIHLDTIPPVLSAQRTTVIPVRKNSSILCQEPGRSASMTRLIRWDRMTFSPKPAGRNIAHSFYNSGEENLCILDIGTVDPEDTCYYPDEQIYLHKSNGERRIYRADDTETTGPPPQPATQAKERRVTIMDTMNAIPQPQELSRPLYRHPRLTGRFNRASGGRGTQPLRLQPTNYETDRCR